MNKDKTLSPYIEVSASFPCRNYARVSLSGKTINSIVFQLAIAPKEVWTHCYDLAPRGRWRSKEEVMEHLDKMLVKLGYAFLTQEEYNRLLPLC